MKPTNEQHTLVPEGDQENFTLDDILREFGSKGAERSQAGSGDDPALRSPLPQHVTRADDPLLRRYQPNPADFPERQPIIRQTAPQWEREPASADEEPDGEAVKIWQGGERDKGHMVSEKTIRFTVPKLQPRMSAVEKPQTETETVEPVAAEQTERQPEYAASLLPENGISTTPDGDTRPRRERKANTPPTLKKPRQKPMATPETRYRNGQTGLNSRRLRLVFCGLFTLLGLVLSGLREQDFLRFYENQTLLGFGEIVIVILCALCAYDVLAMGVARLISLRFGFYPLVLLETILGIIHGFFMISAEQTGFCAMVCLPLTFGLWGLQLQLKGTVSTMDVARRSDGALALTRTPGFYQKKAAILPGKGSLQEFLRENDTLPGAQRILDAYSVVLTLAALGAAILAPGKGVERFVEDWLVILLAGTPLCSFVIWSRPWSILAKRLQEKGAALYGWAGACRLSGKTVVTIADGDLFSQENLKLNGTKFFGGADPDRVVAYGAAVMELAGGGLRELFRQQVELRGVRRYAVSRFQRYDAGGVSGEIGVDSVLVGTLRFMQSMGVDMPAGTKVSQAVYVAINGELAGVFAIHYGVTRAVAEAMAMMTAANGVTTVITAGDFIISEAFLRTKLRADTRRIVFPPLGLRAELAEKKSTEQDKPCVLLQQQSFDATALAVSGGRALCTAVRWGVLVALLGGIVGIGIAVALTLMAAEDALSLVNLMLFQLIWTVPGLLLSGWTRNV